MVYFQHLLPGGIVVILYNWQVSSFAHFDLLETGVVEDEGGLLLLQNGQHLLTCYIPLALYRSS